ncbi:4-oxalocrotonate tautomerase family protein [Phaeobacter sp. BS52]|uniref:Tautomerase n=1 Tax=Phaeobacter piscinae TaxID=1580596 RepID=A0AAN1GT55_9RHOB|nr:4-oxalocrotonate tautomerase family protein [Phaeobacter piscinae]ATG44546.1 putative 4-oxalocrotonate tautomerase [Phaeobacter piscinae]AUQ73310.1 putative 4-oxalocrotonate tautomerase [Phaeobacter piscinae]AUR36860.1 putative 4-oxalocrotonate tautomerase [Phaeobacter piscinae]
MPYVNIKVTREGGPDGTGPSAEQKAQLIRGVTDLLQKVLGKSPATTFVVINEIPLEDWGIGGLPVQEYRIQAQ